MLSSAGLMAFLILGASLHTAAAQETVTIVLINPNSNDTATAGMAAIAQSAAGEKVRVVGRTNADAPALLTTPDDMVKAVKGVEALGVAAAEPNVVGIIVSAFSDPGLKELRGKVKDISVVGIGEEAFHEAAAGGRPFSIVTITPDSGLIESFRAKAEELGYLDQYRGVVVTPGDPMEIVKDEVKLDEALTQAVEKSIKQNDVKAVIMGGGPLSSPAVRIQPKFDVPLIVAVAAATRAVLKESPAAAPK